MDLNAKRLKRACEIYRTEGLISLLRQALGFIKDIFVWNRSFFLFECPVQEFSLAPGQPSCRGHKSFTLKIISSNLEAEKLEAQGFEFRVSVPEAKQRLDVGALAFCLFADHDLAGIGWVALNEKAQKALPDTSLRVNFEKKESFTGGTITFPKYRGMGLMSYGLQERIIFLKEIGIITDRSTALKATHASTNAGIKAGYRIYGEAGFKNRLRSTIWKEWPLS